MEANRISGELAVPVVSARPAAAGQNPQGHLLPIVALPMNVVIVIPAIITWLGGSAGFAWGNLLLLVPAAIFLIVGLTLFCWTTWLFHSRGDGTLAPWKPPKHLVVAGPYRHVRNPMISGIFFLLAAQVLLSGSLGVAIWFAFFVCAKAVYIYFDEEPALKKRFGTSYVDYLRNVPAWIPTLRGWPR